MGRPEEVGLCGERLARIDDHLRQRYIEPGKIAGTLSLVHRRGQVAYCSPQGLMDRERAKPMREDTIFRIYSMSKPITSVALMTLYEEGRFQLDDPVYKTLPEWRDLRVYRAGNHPQFLTEPCARPMTIRDLLTHTSGLTYGFMHRTNVDRAYRRLGIGIGGPRFEGSLREMVEQLAGLPLEFSPGSAWNYSVSTDVVGHLVERLSDRPLDVFLRERLFAPLGMVDTGFQVPADQVERFAACYERGPGKELRLEDDPAKSPYLERRRFLSGGGGMVSTAADYLRFTRMLLGGGELDGARILGRKTVEYMTRNHLPEGREMSEMAYGGFTEIASPGTGFGLGFSVNHDPARGGVIGSEGEFAWGGMASTVFWIDPKEELIALFFTQFVPSRTFNFRGQLKSIIYGAIID